MSRSTSGITESSPKANMKPEHMNKNNDAVRAAREQALEDAARICDEMQSHYSAYKDTALLNGDVELSNAASGEPRAAEFLAGAIRALKSQPAAASSPVQAQPVAVPSEPERMTTDESREYLVKFMEQHFTDKTYHRYIRGERGSVNLAGDFAWQMARALRMLAAPTEPAQQPGELNRRLMDMSEIVRADGRWDGNEFLYAVKSESETSMLDDILTDVFRLTRPTAAIAAARPSAPEGWISVDERLPDENSEIVVIGPAYGDYTKGRYVSRADFMQGVFYSDEGDELYTPSHWIELAASPAPDRSAP